MRRVRGLAEAEPRLGTGQIASGGNFQRGNFEMRCKFKTRFHNQSKSQRTKNLLADELRAA